MEVSLVGTRIYTAYEMDILFPPGLEPVLSYDEEEEENTYCLKTEGNIYKNSHGITSSFGIITPTTMRLSCSSSKSSNFRRESGKLFYFMVKASPYLKPGDVTLKVTNLHFITAENAQQYNCKDQTLTLHAQPTSSLSLMVSGESHYGTCVLPFDVNNLPSDVKAFSAKKLDSTGTFVVLDEVQQMAAYTPYILYSGGGYTGTLSGEVDESRYKETVTDGFLRGAVAPVAKTEGYVLQDLGEGAKFYAMDGQTFNIPEGKCWMELPAMQASAPFYGILIGDDATGITAPHSVPSSHTPVFSLDGKRVTTMQPGGIYVMNGKKVLKIN